MPVYGMSYLCGDGMLSWFGLNHNAWNPSWVSKGNELLSNYVSFSGFSFWAFMIGGNLLGLGLALLAYPIVKRVATMMVSSSHKATKNREVAKSRIIDTVIKSKEAVRSIAEKVAANKPNGKEHSSFAKATADGAPDGFDLEDRSECASCNTE